jgi:hypothetical protein
MKLQKVFIKNTIFNLQANNTTGIVSGIAVQAGLKQLLFIIIKYMIFRHPSASLFGICKWNTRFWNDSRLNNDIHNRIAKHSCSCSKYR